MCFECRCQVCSHKTAQASAVHLRGKEKREELRIPNVGSLGAARQEATCTLPAVSNEQGSGALALLWQWGVNS